VLTALFCVIFWLLKNVRNYESAPKMPAPTLAERV